MSNKPEIKLDGDSMNMSIDISLSFTADNMHEKYELMKMLAETVETTLDFPVEECPKEEIAGIAN